MKCEWKNISNTSESEVLKLKDICCINAKSYNIKDNWQEINYLDTGNIINGKIIGIQHLDCCIDKIPSRARRKVERFDIVYSMVRPNQLHYGIIEQPIQNMLVSTGFAVISIDKSVADPYYVYYYITQNKFTEKLQSIAEQSTSAYPSIRPSDIEDIEIALPPLTTQKSIGDFLHGLDEKCSVNNKINANLQQQAQAIFSNMFINNPDCITVSGRLSDIATVTMGQSPNGDSYNESGEGEVFYQGRAEFGFRFPKRRLYTTEPKRFAESGDVLLSVRAPVGDINIAFERCCIGRGLSALHSKDGNSSFLLYTMFELKSKLDVFNNEGTVFGSINRDSLNNMALDLPSREDICRFENIVRPMDNMIRGNFAENCRLQLIRDSLLPKLMSGEIDVSEINI